jgi:hypothetical protein
MDDLRRLEEIESDIQNKNVAAAEEAQELWSARRAMETARRQSAQHLHLRLQTLARSVASRGRIEVGPVSSDGRQVVRVSAKGSWLGRPAFQYTIAPRLGEPDQFTLKPYLTPIATLGRKQDTLAPYLNDVLGAPSEEKVVDFLLSKVALLPSQPTAPPEWLEGAVKLLIVLMVWAAVWGGFTLWLGFVGFVFGPIAAFWLGLLAARFWGFILVVCGFAVMGVLSRH